jgi:beta-lactamase superfamily II metal-dependent hydrolase
VNCVKESGLIYIGRRSIFIRLAAVIAAVLLLACGCKKDTGGQKPDAEPVTGLSVYFFETKEDSDAILITSPEANIMIDTGLYLEAPKLMDSLSEKNVEHLDLLVLTHPDKDHIGGAQSVLNGLTVDRLIMSRATKNSEEQALLNIAMDRKGLEVDIPTENETFEFGDLKIKVYAAWQEDYEKSNDYSVAVLAEYAGRKFFFPGDAEKERVTELLGEYDIGDIDVYKLPHHGRDGKKAEKLLERLKPEYCVVTAAAPGEKMASAIKELGCEVFSTFDGELKITVDPETGDLKIGNKAR